MNFEEMLNESVEQLDEMAQRSLSGSIEAFSQINTYATSKEQGSFVTLVNRQSGYVGAIEFNTQEKKVYYIDDKNQTIKIEFYSGGSPKKRELENRYVPELLRRASTPGNDLFGF